MKPQFLLLPYLATLTNTKQIKFGFTCVVFFRKIFLEQIPNHYFSVLNEGSF